MEGKTTLGVRQKIPAKSLIPFVLITFGIAWGLISIYIFFEEWATSTLGPISGSHPLFVVAVYSPAIAAMTIVLWFAGLNGLKRFLSRFILWRASPAWYVFLVVGIPLMFYAGAAIKGNLFENLFPFDNFGTFLGAIAFMLVLGPMEEFGWRRLAQPVLQRHLAPLWAAIVVGLVWGIWHLPAFLLSGTPQSSWGFMPFFFSAIGLSIIITGVFNNSRGSILLPALFHFQLNNPLWPDAQPYDGIFVAAVAIAVILLNRRTMFNSADAVKTVIPKTPAKN